MVGRSMGNRIAGGCIAGLLLSAAAGAQVLTFIDGWTDGLGGVDGLNRNRAVVVSEDGKFVYSTGEGDNAVAVFSRDEASGLLTQIQLVKNGVGGVSGIRGANNMALSPQGDNFYVSGFFGDSLAVFARDRDTGLLTEIQVLQDNVDGNALDGALWILVSNNGKNVYVAGFFDDAVSVYDRDQHDGTLTLRQVLKDGVGGVDNLNGVYPLFMDKSGKNVYAGATEDDAITVFRRNHSNGELTQIQVLKDGVGGLDGLRSVRGLIADKNGDHLYATGLLDNSISAFERDHSDGSLTQIQVIKDSGPGIDGLFGATGINITPDGDFVFATAFGERKLSVWERDDHTGLLTLAQVVINGIDTPCCILGPIDLYPSPDGRHLYGANVNSSTLLLYGIAGDHGGDDDD